MDLIVTHTNADFDALGSLIAAKKLYPHSRLLLPGSPQKALMEFLSLFKDVIKTESEGECDLGDIDRLIIVDTRHKSRIGIASRLIDKRGCKIIVYDHHPRTKYDVAATRDIYEELGATVTILLNMLMKRRIKLSSIEATILLLGIYEETGLLTFRTTTKKDVDAVSFLLSHGARLNMVSSYLNRELDEGQLAFLVRLINSTHIYNINGVKIAIAASDMNCYVGEMGTIINKLISVENLKVLFLLLKGRSKITIIARSHIQDVDVNKILKHFGGAGHPAAASGIVRGPEMEALRQKLLAILKRNIKVRVCAEDIMSAPVAVFVDDKIEDVKRCLLRNKAEAAAVVSENNGFLGIIHMKNVNKAIRRKFGHARVKGYMHTEINRAGPKTPLYAVQELLLKNKAGILPVIKQKRLIGVITGNDVLKVVHLGLIVEERIAERIAGAAGPILNLSKKMQKVLPKKIVSLLRLIGDMARERHTAAFAVGGFVRDLIMGVKNFDIDIVTEESAQEFSKAFADKVKGALIIHKKFGTASVVMIRGLAPGKRFKVDIATARKERYSKPAALPDVEFSSLRDDLCRRDFTINAMAIALNRKNFGQVIDFFGGRSHIRQKVISVLHKDSFIDDPTRIFRAVRFEQRFGFRIDKETEELIKTAIRMDMFQKTEKQRIRDELILMLKEEEPLRAILRMQQLDELRFIHPKIKIEKASRQLFKAIEDVCIWYRNSPLKKRRVDKWLIFLMALFENLDKRSIRGLCNKFVFRRGDRIRILSYKYEGGMVLKLFSEKRPLPPSLVYRKLHKLSYEVILLLMARAESPFSKEAIKNFLLRYSKVRIGVNGDDLEKLGYRPGPIFGKVLKKILYAKIDGKLKTRRDELLFAREMLE